MKTPEEIKSDVATCLTRPQHSRCDRFALYEECKGDCRYVIKELYDLVLHYESRLAQVERERDALMAYVPHNCYSCKHEETRYKCGRPCNWEWRGVCAENTKEQQANAPEVEG